MKTTALMCLFLTLSVPVFSQDWEVPKHYTLEGAEDYTQYEDDIIQAANWLRDNSPTADIQKYQDAAQFVIKWVNGSPTVTVMITPVIMDFNNKNPNMLVLYMASCAKYVLENAYSKDTNAQQKSALKDMVEAYQKQTTMSKDKKMDKLVKAFNDGSIDTWMQKNMYTGG
jgi:hypothetical protein